MRNVIVEQMELGETGIRNIQFDLASRDQIPKLLAGLQYIYCNENEEFQNSGESK